MPSPDTLFRCYEDVLRLDRSVPDPKLKLPQISEKIVEILPDILGIFRSITDMDGLDSYLADYSMTETQLDESIRVENDSVRKICLLTEAFQRIFYRVLSAEGNYEFHLRGQDEMQHLPENIDYYVVRSIKNEQNLHFHAFFVIYALGSLFTPYQYVGIDYEQTNKQIQLAQMNFEHHSINTAFIMIVAPPELGKEMTDHLIELIYCNRRIRKILHGSDSLDARYLYNELLENDSLKIISFMKGLVDSRWLCEYYKVNLNDPSNNKCAIYDPEPSRSAVFYFGLVDEQQQSRLQAMFDDLPPHDMVVWNVHRMPSAQVRYAQYDVLYLKHFCYRIAAVASRGLSDVQQIKNMCSLYMEIIPQTTQFVYLENINVTNLRLRCKTEVDPCNNYYIKKDGKIIKMIDIYNALLPGLKTDNPPVEIGKLTMVSHFKVTINTVIKRLIYGHISRKCSVNKDREHPWKERLDNQFILEYFREMGFGYLESIFTELNAITARGVAKYCTRS